MTPKKPKTESKERASIGRERRLALALAAVLDEVTEVEAIRALDVYTDAHTTLDELGYKSLEGIPRRVANLNKQLKAALESRDGAEIAKLGIELERAKLGKPPKVTQESKKSVRPAAGRSLRKTGAQVDTQNTETLKDGAGSVTESEAA